MAEEARPLSPGDVARAERLRARAAADGRWYVWYLAAVAVLSAALVVAVEAFFVDGFARHLALAGWLLATLPVTWWAERRRVRPRGATRSLTVAAAVWFLGYLLLVGPLVRWQFDTSPAAWSLAAAGMSLPFAAAAALMWRRTR
jgi:hypothetical protein